MLSPGPSSVADPSSSNNDTAPETTTTMSSVGVRWKNGFSSGPAGGSSTRRHRNAPAPSSTATLSSPAVGSGPSTAGGTSSLAHSSVTTTGGVDRQIVVGVAQDVIADDPSAALSVTTRSTSGGDAEAGRD